MSRPPQAVRPCRSSPPWKGCVQGGLGFLLACLLQGAGAADATNPATPSTATATVGKARSDLRPLRIGLLVPPDDALGASLQRGARLGAAKLGAAFPGALELVVRGRVGQWGDDGDEAGRLVLDDQAQVLIAPPGGVPSHLVLQVAGRTRTPVILLSPDASVTAAGVPWVLRLVPSTSDQLAALMRPGRTRVLVREGRPARELAADLERWRSQPGTIPTGAGLREVQVTPVAASGPRDMDGLKERAAAWLETPDDAILLWLDPAEAAVWARALRGAGFRGVFGGPGWLRSPSFVEAAGPAAAGLRVTESDPAAWPIESRAALRAFIGDFRAETGREPDAAAVAAADAVGLAAALVERAEDRPLVTVFPIQGELGHGLTGRWKFDRLGNREDSLRVIVWTGSGWRPEAPQP